MFSSLLFRVGEEYRSERRSITTAHGTPAMKANNQDTFGAEIKFLFNWDQPSHQL
jgi:hypothetical protein